MSEFEKWDDEDLQYLNDAGYPCAEEHITECYAEIDRLGEELKDTQVTAHYYKAKYESLAREIREVLETEVDDV